VVALCDIDEEKARQTGRDFGLSAEIYTDYVRMLDEAKPEVVHVCTPHYLHAEMIIAALARNIHVLTEKPLCIKREDIARILEAEAASEAILGVCHQNHYNPANVFVREYLKDRRVLTAHGAVVWHRDAAYYASGPWRGAWSTEGGGVMINQALHTIDLLQWMLGEPTEVAATCSNLTLRDVIEVEDTASATFRGATAPYTFFATNAAGATMPVMLTFKLEGGHDLTVLPHTVLLDNEVIFAEERRTVRGKVCYGASHDVLIPDFYDCIETGRHFPIDGAEGAKVIRMILAMYESNGAFCKIN
jgi:predicted dehydrogenase